MDDTSAGSVVELARRAITDLLHLTEPASFGEVFNHPDVHVRRQPTSLSTTKAARDLAVAFQRLVLEHALSARGAGESWEDVAQALNLWNDGCPDSVAAYLTVLGVRSDDPWWSPARGVLWTCTTCEEAVRDFGPDCGGPDDRESGHALTCSRHVADVLAWDALWA